ncbi:Protein of unknown function [Thermobacillus xylanilyticus]|uniref:Uncharacterized protein n=1 Tax=Thermobacillus xylanilyticus TaxID=76633 RepID=A0ABM8V0V5_THEXY|nr:Protein of unknown function [Thermobacillus xylanilyticus]
MEMPSCLSRRMAVSWRSCVTSSL